MEERVFLWLQIRSGELIRDCIDTYETNEDASCRNLPKGN